MFLKQTPTSKGIFLQIVESFHDKGVSRQRVIEKLGYLHDFESIHKEPLSFFRDKAKKMTLEKKLASSDTLSIHLDTAMSLQEDSFFKCRLCHFK